MNLSGNFGRSAFDLFAELFPTGTTSLDVSNQNSHSADEPSQSIASNGAEHAELTDQAAATAFVAPSANETTGSTASIDLDTQSLESLDDSSTGQSHVSAAFSLTPPLDSDEAFSALSSDHYWSNDVDVGHWINGLSSNLDGNQVTFTANGSGAISGGDFEWSHNGSTVNDALGAVSASIDDNASHAAVPADLPSAVVPPISPAEATFSSAPSSHPSEASPSLLLMGDLGTFSASSAGTGTGTGTGSSGTLVSGGGSAGLVININWDASVANAPVGFQTGVESVVSYFESHFSNPITITIDVGYGEVMGSALGAGALGESESYITSTSYSALEAALVKNANAIGDTAAAASLPATSPVNGTYYLTTAEMQALGLTSSSGVNGYIGLSSSYSWCFNDANGVPAGQFDFFGTVAHEITEVMGRLMFAGSGGEYSPLDLFHYSAAGVRDFSGSTAGYFSADGGTTNLGNFNTNSGGDYGDWAGSVGNNAFLAFSNSGVVNPVTANDLTEMNVLGWQPTSSGGAPAVTIALADNTSGGNAITANDALTGSADANARVTITEGSTVLGTTTANGSGVWLFTPTGLAQGLQTITASETNAAGLTGSSSLTFTYDTTAPTVTIALADDTSGGNAITTNDALTGSADPNATVTISEGSTVLGTTTANASGVWSFTPTILPQGLQTITASETDAAGLTGSSSLTFTYDRPNLSFSWIKAGGDWNTGSNWSPAGVPGAGDTALITKSGTYTVTSSQSNSVAILNTETYLTLAINAAAFDITGGTGAGKLAGKIAVADAASLGLGADATQSTFNYTAVTTLAAGADPTDLVISGDVTLNGAGKINLSDSNDQIVSDGTLSSLTTIGGTTIAGAGTIGDGDLSVINQAKGIINANSSVGSALTIATANFSNAGLVEATSHGVLVLDGDIANASTGIVKAAASGTYIELDGATITGGTISNVSGSSIDSIGGASEISTSTTLVNAGRLGAEGGDLTITGPVKSTGTLDANGALLDLAGSFSGSGKATIENGGTLEFGGTAIKETVTFTNSGAGIETLKFDAAASTNAALIYNGMISGFSNSSDVIDFTGLTFVGTTNPLHLTLSSGNTIVTITEGTDQVSFKLAGNHLADSFIVSQDSGTGTQIIDPPPPTASAAAPTSVMANGAAVAVSGDHFIFASGAEANATRHDGLDGSERVGDLGHGIGEQLAQELHAAIASWPTFDPFHHSDGSLSQSWETQFHQIVQAAHSGILH
jgi:Bacterial Ig domain